MKGTFRSCLIFLGLSYLPFLNQVSLLINGIFFLNVILAIWQEGQKRQISQLIRVGLMMMGIALIFNEYQTLWGLEPGVAILSLMATLKIFELNQKRDFFLFVLIVELSLVGHVLTVDHLYMVIYVIILSLLLFALLFTYHTGEQRVVWNRARKKVFAQIFLYSLPLAFGLFFLFPRLTLGNIFFNTIKKQDLTGFSDEIRPGTIAKVMQNKATYFRAKFLDEKTPSYFELYWRGSILSKTDGFTWTRLKPPGKRAESLVGPVKYRYEVTFDVFMNSPLFLLEGTNSFKTNTKGHLLKSGAGTYRFFPFSNQKISFSGETGKRRPLELKENLREHYLQLPPESKMRRFSAWVKGLGLEGQQLRSYAKTFSEWVKNNGFTYTLNPGKISSEAPLDEFFFNSKIGFCEHYAASFALYLRLLGVPSRVVVGFHGGEFNPLGKYYIVKGLDAHAWVEGWDDKKGWITFDPTAYVAPNRIRYGSASYFLDDEDTQGISMDVYLEGRNSEFLQGILFALDMFYYEANREFVGFDLERQKSLFNFLGSDNLAWPWKLILMCLIFASLFLIPLFWQLKKAMRLRDPYWRGYKRLIRKLQKSGMDVPEWQGPLVLCERCLKEFPELREDIEKAFSLFTRGVYRQREKGLEKQENSEYQDFRNVIKRLTFPKVDQKSI